MSRNVLGPVAGVIVSALISTAGVFVARMTGSDVATVTIQLHAAATVVLLVTILVRLES